MVLCELWKDHKTPYKGIADIVGEALEGQVCRIANSARYHCCFAWRKPFLNKAAIKKHLAWAQFNKRRDWDTITWTNETQVELEKRPGQDHVTRKAGKKFLVNNVQFSTPSNHSETFSRLIWHIKEDFKNPWMHFGRWHNQCGWTCWRLGGGNGQGHGEHVKKSGSCYQGKAEHRFRYAIGIPVHT